MLSAFAFAWKWWQHIPQEKCIFLRLVALLILWKQYHVLLPVTICVHLCESFCEHLWYPGCYMILCVVLTLLLNCTASAGMLHCLCMNSFLHFCNIVGCRINVGIAWPCLIIYSLHTWMVQILDVTLSLLTTLSTKEVGDCVGWTNSAAALFSFVLFQPFYCTAYGQYFCVACSTMSSHATRFIA